MRLLIDVGPLPRASAIAVRSENGKRLGSVSPFGVREAQAGGGYGFAVPPNLVQDGRVRIKLAVKHYGSALRAPSATEVRKVSLVCAPS
ncbi:MAG: hypothetical protein JOZ13_04125 [Alphaproteobacteria bacterium]|nr:hypothetical protein [Alphaproteobacteria bacterium]